MFIRAREPRVAVFSLWIQYTPFQSISPTPF